MHLSRTGQLAIKKITAAVTLAFMLSPLAASAADYLCKTTTGNSSQSACYDSATVCKQENHCAAGDAKCCVCAKDASCSGAATGLTPSNPDPSTTQANCKTTYCSWTQKDGLGGSKVAYGCFADQSQCDARAGSTCTCFAPDQKAQNDAAKAAAPTAAPAKTKLVDPLGNIGIRLLVARVTNMLMGLSGTFALVAFVYGGFKMITANGNDKKYAEGLNSLKWAIVGIVIIFGSYALLNALFTALSGAAS